MNITVSNVKAIGIILMVIGHAIAGLVGIYGFAYNFIYLFHMPLFFFCSGFFFKNSYSDTFSKLLVFFKKKVKGLWLPYVKWCLFFILIHNILVCCHFYSFDIKPYYSIEQYTIYILKSLVFTYDSDDMLGGFWFIGQLFWCSLFSCGLLFILRKIRIFSYLSEKLIAIVLLMFLAMIVNYLGKGISFLEINQRTFFCGTWFISGMLYAKYQDKIKLTAYLGGFSLLVLLLISYFGSLTDITQHTSRVDTFYIPLKFLIALFGIYLTFYFVTRRKIMNSKWLTYVGNNTMIILALHLSCFKIVSWFICTIYNRSLNDISLFPIIPYKSFLFMLLYVLFGITIPLIIDRIYVYLKKQI